MKVAFRWLVLYVFIIAQLFSGVISEVIVWLCMIYMIATQSNHIKAIVGKKVYTLSIVFIIFYALLYLIQICISNNLNVVRLFGLTKCICAPALMILAFGGLSTDRNVIKPLMLMMLVFNIIYVIALLLTGFNYSFSSLLGSYNGCATIGVIIFPSVVQFYRMQSRKSANRVFTRIYLLSFIVLLLISGSTTAQAIFLFQIMAFLFARLRVYGILNKLLRGVMSVLPVGLIIFVFAIATGYIKTTGQELATRTAIWTRSYEYFTSFDGVHICFGTGNDIVQMMTKSLESHNMFMEILLIYGALGLIVFVLYLIGIIRGLIQSRSENSLTIFISVISYVAVCCIHPFYTGLFPFQTICLLAILSSIYAFSNTYSNKTDIDEIGVSYEKRYYKKA